MSEENKIRDTIEAVRGLFEAVPIYPDLIQPAAKEVGAAAGTIAKAGRQVVDGSYATLVWSYGQIKDFVIPAISEKIRERQVPQERLTLPHPIIAGPALEALRFAGSEPTL